jgi:hypothetical protein
LTIRLLPLPLDIEGPTPAPMIVVDGVGVDIALGD